MSGTALARRAAGAPAVARGWLAARRVVGRLARSVPRSVLVEVISPWPRLTPFGVAAVDGGICESGVVGVACATRVTCAGDVAADCSNDRRVARCVMPAVTITSAAAAIAGRPHDRRAG